MSEHARQTCRTCRADLPLTKHHFTCRKRYRAGGVEKIEWTLDCKPCSNKKYRERYSSYVPTSGKNGVQKPIAHTGPTDPALRLFFCTVAPTPLGIELRAERTESCAKSAQTR